MGQQAPNFPITFKMEFPVSINKLVRLLSLPWVAVSIGLSCLPSSNIAQAAQDDLPSTADHKMLSGYKAAMADGDQAAALEFVLEYAEKTYGENAPETVKLTHRYGYLLYQNREYRKATEVLKKALERSTAAHGESGGEAFEINMNIGYALSQWRPSLSARTKYFDRALEILRDRGEHESVAYVTALINIVVNLMDNDGLKGEYSANAGEYFDSLERDDYFASVEHEYSNYFHIAEEYVIEAVELGKKLEIQDEYISSKIAIAQAKLNVMETADLAAVPMGVYGYISGGTENDRYDREEERLTTAIDKLSQDIETNKIFLHAANKVLMEIAWLDKDEARMAAMCANGALNSASEYPPDRIYEVTENGAVIAPDINLRVSTNIFKSLRSRGEPPKDEYGNPVKRPYFVPVCIDGRLMAALINAPRVTVEEIWK
jgi:tetratricopeptide (TPR) repeat protein